MKQSKHTTSYWHKLMGVVLLVSVVLCNLIGLVSAKFVQDIDAGSITVAKNYYTVTYYDSDNTRVLYEDDITNIDDYVIRGSTGVTIPDDATFAYWSTADNTKVTPEYLSRGVDCSLYPAFDYTDIVEIRFMDKNNEKVVSTFFYDEYKHDKIDVVFPSIDSEDYKWADENIKFDHWAVQTDDGETAWDDYTIDTSKDTIIVVPRYKYTDTTGTSVLLTLVDSDGDGSYDIYRVDGYGDASGQKLVEIPAYVNGIPVTTINQDAFSSYEDIYAVVIPTSIKNIGKYAFAADWVDLDTGETITIYYEGTYEQWQAIEKLDEWDHGLGAGSRIFFLDEDGKVDTAQGYLLASVETTGFWILQTATDIWWDEGEETFEDMYKDVYSKAGRPDAEYWTNFATTE